MKKALCVLAALAFVASASATIDIFISDVEAISGGFAMDHSPMDFRPYWNSAADVAIATPDDMGACVDGNTKTYYVWGQVDSGDWYAQIYGLHIAAYTTGCMTLDNSVIYRQYVTTLDKAGQVVELWKRWDGDQPIDMDGCDGHGIGAAVQSDGINVNFDQSLGYDLYAKGYTFLIGAVQVSCGEGGDGELYIGLGTLGIIKNPGSPTRPDVTILGQSVVNPYVPVPAGELGVCQWVQAAYCTPEPASILLIGLAGLFLRRR